MERVHETVHETVTMSNKDHENQYLVTAGGKEEPYPKFKPDTWRHEGQRTWSDYFLGRPPGESFMFVDDQGNQHTHFVSGKDEGRRRTKRIGEVQNATRVNNLGKKTMCLKTGAGPL